jgi:hypothetical protein
VAVLVVDGLEAVEVAEQHGEHTLAAGAVGGRLLEAVVEVSAVAEAGEWVLRGQGVQALGFGASLGDVFDLGDRVTGGVVPAADHGAVDLDPDDPAVGVQQPGFDGQGAGCVVQVR